MRTHVEALDPAVVELWSDEAGTSCVGSDDRARQEFAEEADINVILRRAGGGGYEKRPVVYGVQDTSWDLQSVYESQQELADAWGRLPERLRARYQGWEDLLPALERGDATLVDPDGTVVEPPVPDRVPPVAG